ncbi:MAG TPA: ATP-binding protein [Desulfobacteraceae bacterium]|nr:ATP-binding protein [Desulfobacteraceae bacterium]
MAESGGVYELMKSEHRLEIRFSSTMDHIDDVCASVTLFLESKGKLFAPHIFSVNLVLREGLTNAVRHGNRNDPEKMVRMELDIGADNAIRVCVADQGDGFDWQHVKSATLPDEADHGRGVPIMETYFSRCRYNQKGNILYLEKLI